MHIRRPEAGAVQVWAVRLERCAAFVVPLVVYVQCLTGAPGGWDIGEAQTVPYILGIFHPTGFPLYTLVGWAFTHVVPVGTVAWRMNLLSAVSVATAVALLRATAIELGAARLTALGASFLFAFGPVIWFKACHSDVHAFNLAIVATALYFAVRAIRRPQSGSAVWSCLAFGCGLATHPVTLWIAPAVAVAVVCAALEGRGKLVVASGTALLAPLLIYGYLPIRSWLIVRAGLDPIAAAPFYGHGEMMWNVDDPRTPAGFLKIVTGSDFAASSRLGAFLQVDAYPSYVAFWWNAAKNELGALTPLVVAAVVLRARRAGAAAWALAASGFAAIPFTAAYAPVEGDVARYMMPSFFALCAIAATVTRSFSLPARRYANAAWAVLLVIAAAGLHSEHGGMYLYRNDRGGLGAIAEVRSGTPDGAIVVSGWVDASTLGYAAYVEHSVGSRIIVSGWPAEYRDDFAAWRKARRIFLYVDQNGEGNLPNIPAAWLREVPGTRIGNHRILEVDSGGRAAI